ncbi:hypothetical protein ES703_12800 [subsurface metagenome]
MCPYPPQGAGVASFLGLLDTPVSYAGEAQRGARVNVTENAIEFSPMAAERTFPSFVTTALYNAIKADAWEDLDCGVGAAWVYIKCEVAGPGGAIKILFRPNGETAAIHNASFMNGLFSAGKTITYIMCPTDSGGIVEWRCDAGANAITLTLLGYWPNPPMPEVQLFTGLTVNAWQTLAVGVPHALCILRMTCNAIPGGFVNYLFRMTDDTEECEYGVEWAQQVGVGSIAYVLISTDGDGNVHYKFPPDNQDVTIDLHSYILGPEFTDIMLYSGAYPAAYQDLPTPFGKCFMLVKEIHTLAGGFPTTSFRQNGEARSLIHASENCLCTMGPALNSMAYHFVLLDSYGICEWEGSAAMSCELKAKLISR